MIITVLAVTGMILLAREPVQQEGNSPAGHATTLKPIGRLLAGKYYVDELYQAVITNPLARIIREAVFICRDKNCGCGWLKVWVQQ